MPGISHAGKAEPQGRLPHVCCQIPVHLSSPTMFALHPLPPFSYTPAVEERLRILDNYLQEFEARPVDSAVKPQPLFKVCNRGNLALRRGGHLCAPAPWQAAPGRALLQAGPYMLQRRCLSDPLLSLFLPSFQHAQQPAPPPPLAGAAPGGGPLRCGGGRGRGGPAPRLCLPQLAAHRGAAGPGD
jgi:hypothetical protein